MYSNSGLTKGYGWIYPTDEVQVITVTSRYTKVIYPISRGRYKTGYIATGNILTATGGSTYTSTEGIVQQILMDMLTGMIKFWYLGAEVILRR